MVKLIVTTMRLLMLMTSLFVLKTSARGRCSNTWTIFDNSCYTYIAEKMTWFDAQVACKTANSHLVRIDSSSEDRFVVSLARTHGANVWIGLSDLFHEKRFVWDDTQLEPVYTNWWPGQPDNHRGIENCGMLSYEFNSMWNDSPCTLTHPAICEKKVLE